MKRLIAFMLMAGLCVPMALSLFSCEEKEHKKKKTMEIRQETVVDTEKGVVQQKTTKEYK